MYYNNAYFSIDAEFNKKFYISFDNVLRAARLLRVDFYLSSGEHFCTFEVAGLGKISEEVCGDSMQLKIKHLKAYPSIEDFKANRSMSVIYKNGMSFHTKDILKGAFGEIADIQGCDRFQIFRYKWNGTKAVKVGFDPGFDVWMDKDGFHTNAVIPAYTFRTAKECEDANQISVIEFEDEK